VATLERQNEELKANVAELEAALERKTEATTEAPKEEGSEAECQCRVTCRRVQMVAADPDDRECVALRSLQPLDVFMNKPFKDKIRKLHTLDVRRWA
jgi:hypothetical protein